MFRFNRFRRKIQFQFILAIFLFLVWIAIILIKSNTIEFTENQIGENGIREVGIQNHVNNVEKKQESITVGENIKIKYNIVKKLDRHRIIGKIPENHMPEGPKHKLNGLEYTPQLKDVNNYRNPSDRVIIYLTDDYRV